MSSGATSAIGPRKVPAAFRVPIRRKQDHVGVDKKCVPRRRHGEQPVQCDRLTATLHTNFRTHVPRDFH